MPGRPIVIVGEYYDPTLSIGGGPIIPTPQPPSPGVPTHPIFYPPGIWGPTDPRPGWGLPGGGGSPGVPTHPIFYPPGIWGPTDPRPGWGPVGPQPGPWPPLFPTPPIYIPIQPPGGGGGGGGSGNENPSQPISEPPTDNPYWQQVFLPNTGWVWAIVPPPHWQPGQGGGSGGGQPPSGGNGEEGSGSPSR